MGTTAYKCWPANALPSQEFLNTLIEKAFEQDQSQLFSSENMPRLRKEDVSKPAVYIGAGTCGLGAGAEKTLEAVRTFLKKRNIEDQVDIIEVGCIGLCATEPIMDIQLPGKARVSYQKVTADKADSILEPALKGKFPAENVLGQFRSPGILQWEKIPFIDEHPFFTCQNRWVLANCGILNPVDINEYIAKGGYTAFYKAITAKTPEELCDIVEKAGLRGRGGGGFLTGKKWKLALKTESDQKYLVCNADEGDPGAFMDRAVIEGDPQRLLEGLSIAAYAIGATKAYIYIRAEYPLAIKRLNLAIEQAKEYKLLGHNILESGFNLDITIKKGAGAFVCGEETALLHSIEGKRGMPRPRPPFPASEGLFNKPTIINNVETMANLPLLVLNGAEWFSSSGTETSKGTKVFALSGKVKNTGLVEVTMGTSLRDIVFNIGDGIPNGKKFKAVQIGGPSGGCIPESHIDIEIDYESLKTVGAMMGSGGLVVMDEDTCMVDVAKFFMDFIQRESCGKCIPCREGTKRMLEILESITRGRKSEKGYDSLYRMKGVMTLEKLARNIRITSLCGLGQTAPNPVLSTLRWFPDEYDEHIFERRCSSGVCKELVTYKIDNNKCIGCTLCSRKCPAEAIKGEKKAPHYILNDLCIGCGACRDVCPKGAVIIE